MISNNYPCIRGRIRPDLSTWGTRFETRQTDLRYLLPRVCYLFCIEKSRAVLYSDFVTILQMVLMQYIPKLAMSQSQKPRSSLSPKIWSTLKSEDASVRSVKISPVHSKVLQGLVRIYSPIRFLWTNKCIFIYSYLFALKSFKFTNMKKQLSSIWRHKN